MSNETRGFIEISFDQAMLLEMKRRLGNMPDDIDKTIAGSINDALKFIQRSAVSEVNKRLMLTKRQIRNDTRIWRANKNDLTGKFTFRIRRRIPLLPDPHPFKARQTKKGVTYRVDRRKGRQIILGAFGPEIKALGYRTFVRQGRGRFPIVQRRGASPWGVFVKNRLDLSMRKVGMAELRKIVDRRINLMILRRGGVVPEGGPA